ncbi:uncharacterized MFS-type transporter C09D4.1-like [Planococcus citri]|uniref:uncharacterized MFS-type transporter C09D4.1-like n=1 Tax=Planococcus citri TaxID=170843 RepID=UPI0031F73B13
MIEKPKIEYKLYTRRWFNMALFVMYTINAGAQWLQFSIIDNLVQKYYEGITPESIEWTTMSSMLAYVPFTFPSLYLLDKLGVRTTMIIGITGFTIGTWIKVFSVHRESFYLVLTGTAVQAGFQVLTFALSARFTAIWFGAHEISTAGALCLFGDQLGVAISSFIPKILVKDDSIEVIRNGLQKMHWLHAGVSTAVLVLIVSFFKAQPKSPPSAAQASQRQTERKHVYQAVKSIVKKPSFILISLSYGLNLGLINAVISLLNRNISINFPERTLDAGYIGTLILFSGMISSLFFGKIIDKTRKFKESAVLLTSGSAIAFMAFTWALESDNIIYVYVASFFIGSFTLSYYGTGFQMAIEVTFPISEEISAATSFLITEFLSFVITSSYGYLIGKYSSLPSNVVLIVLFFLAALCAYLVPSDLRRQQVEESAREKTREKEMADLISNKI